MAAGLVVLFLGVSMLCHATANELKYDEALLTVNNHLLEPITLLYVSDYCYKCLLQPLMTLPAAQSLQPTNNTIIISTVFALTVHVLRGGGNQDPVCSWKQLYEEHGHYVISIQSKNRTMQCYNLVSRSPSNYLLPLLAAVVSLLCVWGLYYFTAYVFRLACTQKLLEELKKKMGCMLKDEDDVSVSQRQNTEVPKHRRLLSLDTFRG
ncbi:uncharacterized protein LOC122942083 [Bufo gargarizans]|uniref:uncharacterized protein LOC122942083 n=1 Tax=Bufo gargarizans TaxID=30331 RepID=UPI001CF3C9F9|nr:uncharacterized protein LOC122942083 [Bufo gargarizans]